MSAICQTHSNVNYDIFFDSVENVSSIVPISSSQSFDVVYQYAYAFDNVTWTEWFDSSEQLITHLNNNDMHFSNVYVKTRVSASKNVDMSSYAFYKLECLEINGQAATVLNMNFAKSNDILRRTATKNLYHPYRNVDNIQRLNKILARSISDIFSFEVSYFRTEANQERRMSTFKTFPLVDVVETKPMKVLINNNQLPDNRYQYSEFDYDFADELEIHIVIDVWREIFGDIEPNANDYLFLPLTNRMYQINTSYEAKGFMHKSTFYRLMLVQYEKRADVIETDSIAAEALEYIEYVDSFDQDKIDAEQNDSTLNDLVQPSELELEQSVQISDDVSLSKNGVDVVNFLYDLSQIENNVSGAYYDEIQMNNDQPFSLSFWFKKDKIDKRTIEIVTHLVSAESSNERLFKLYDTSNKSLTFELSQEPYEKVSLTALLNQDLQVDKLYGVLINCGHNDSGDFVSMSIIDESFAKIAEASDQELSISFKAVTKMRLHGGLHIGNVRLKKSIVERENIVNELANKLPKSSNYYIADNAIPLLTSSNSDTSCNDTTKHQITTNIISKAQKENIKEILIICADPNNVVEEVSTAERNVLQFVDLSIIYNTDTKYYERLESGEWVEYKITKQDVIDLREM